MLRFIDRSIFDPDQSNWTKKQRYLFRKNPVDFFDYNYPTNYFWLRLVGPIGKIIQWFLWNIKVEGRDNIPKDRNFILMPNHNSHGDSFFPYVNIWPRSGIHAIADEKLYKNKVFRIVARMFNAFPVRKGAKNLRVVEHAIDRVNSGDHMLWYPEGRRHKNPSSNKTNTGRLGSGMIAHAVKAPIIPVFLAGTEFMMPLGKGVRWGKGPRSIKILVRFGKPVYLDDLRQLPPSKEVSQKTVDRIMDAIEALRHKGPYRDQSHR